MHLDAYVRRLDILLILTPMNNPIHERLTRRTCFIPRERYESVCITSGRFMCRDGVESKLNYILLHNSHIITTIKTPSYRIPVANNMDTIDSNWLETRNNLPACICVSKILHANLSEI